MAKYSIEDTTLTNIADAIRTKTGSSSSIMVQDMASEISGIKGEPTLQTKTVTPSTSSQTITPDSGYGGLSQVTVNAMPTATQATPSITINSSGLITASATQSAGYVASGTKQATKQLTTQAAKTITPSTSSQTAVASGRYTTGAVTVKGDANLKAENIKSGVSIFGVTGTASGSEDLDTELTEQENLISQLSTILDSKASGGSGGGNVETCTVTFMPPKQGNTHMTTTYMVYENNEFKWKTYNNNIFSAESEPIIIYPVKYSLIQYWYQYSMLAASGACEYISKFRSGDTGGYVVWVFGDTTIAITNPCFVYDTQITLINGLQKAVQDITYNDELLVWDFDNACYASAKPLWIKKQQSSSYYYHCEFENGLTLNLVGANEKCHRVFCIDEGCFESATDCVGKMVMTELGATKLISCDKVEKTVEYYNIITKYHLNLFANSVLTSCRLNNLYPIEDMKFVKDNQNYTPYEAYSNIAMDFYEGLRLSERNSDDICWINDYVGNLYALMEIKEG